MSATIEERVVAMKFDNSNFEKNVKTSMSTLDKLKDALNFNSAKDSVKTLNEATKSVDFSKMANSIDSIADRFSALGVVGMSVLNNLTNKATDAALNILGKVPSMIIEGGWKRATDVEQARFTLQGVIGDMEEVEKVMDDAKDSVNGTAYAYNDAAKAASVFAASGLRSGEEMQKVLKAVAGTAATANADYEGIAHIFQTIAGQGRVMGEQLNQFANRGINAAATLSNYFNGVMEGSIEASDAVTEAIYEITDGYEVTEGDIRDFASKSLISFDIFSEAMSTTFGDHAKDANKTFSGALANIRAALARTGEAFFKHLVEQEGPAVNLFNAIRLKINDMNNAWAPAAEEAANAVNKIIDAFRGLIEALPIINITNTLINAFKTLGNILRPFLQIIVSIGNAFGQAFDFGRTSDMIYRFSVQVENFTRNLALSEDTVKGITKVFKGFFDIIAAVGDVIFEFIGSIKIAKVPFQSFTDIIGKFLYRVGIALSTIASMIKSSESLRYAFKKLADTLSGFGKTIGSAFKGIAEIFENIAKTSMLAGYNIGSFIGSLAVKALEIFATALEKIVYFLDLFAKYIVVPALETFAGLIANAVRSLQEFFNEIRKSKRIKKAFEKISSAMERLFTAVKNVFKPLGDMFSSFHDNADKATDSVGGFLASLAIDAVTVFVEALAKVVEFLEKVAEKFVIPALDIFIENVGKATGKMVEFAETHSFTDVLDGIKEKLGAVAEGFKGFFSSLDENDGILYRAVEGIKKMYENFKLLQGGASAHTLYDEETGEFIETVDEVSDKESIISKIANAFKTFGENVKDAMEKAYEAVKGFIDYIWTSSPQQLADDIRESLIKLKDKLSELIDKFKVWAGVTGENAEGIKNPFERATTAIRNFFGELDADKLIAIIFTGVMIAMLISILKMTGAFTKLIEGVTGAVEGFEKVTNSVSGFFDRLKNPQKSKLLEFAEAFALIAASLAVLTLVDTTKLGQVAIMMVILSAVIVGLVVVLSLVAKAVKNKDAIKALKTLSLTLISISASVLILIAAVKVLESVDILAAEKAVLIIGELGLIMVGLSVILSRFVKGSIKGFLTMLGFAIIIGKVAKALQTISKVDFSNIQNNLGGFALAIGGVALVAFAASQMRLTAGLGLLIFVYSLEKILNKLNELALDIDGQKILDLIRNNIDVVFAIGLLVAGMIVVSGIFGKGIKNFGIGMVLLAIATAIMGHAIKTIGSIDPSLVETGLKVITRVMLLFGLLAVVLQIGGKNQALKIAAAIGALSLCLYPIAGAIWLIGSMDTKKATQGVIAVAVIMVMFALIVDAASSGIGKVGVGQMIAITVAVVALVMEMIVLTFIPYQQIISAAGSLFAVMLGFSLVLRTIGKIEKIKASTIGTLILLAAMVGALAFAIYKMADKDWKGMLSAGGAIAAVLISLGIVVKIINSIDWENGLGAVTTVLYLCIALIPIGIALWKLSAYDWKGMLAAAGAISIVLLSLSLAVKIIEGVDWNNAIGAATAVITLCVTFIPIGIALWKLSEYDWQGMLGAAASMSILVLALSLAVKLMDGVDWNSGLAGAVSAAILSVALIPIAYAMSMIAGYDWQSLIGAAIALSTVLLVMSGVTLIAKMIGTGAGYAIVGALGIVAVIAIVELAMIALAALTNAIMNEWGDSITNGLDYMILIAGKLGEAIGSFVGGIIGTAGLKILEDISTGLSIFATNADPFVQWLKTIDDASIEGVKKLAEILIIFGGATLISAMMSLIGLPGLLALPAQMWAIGTALKVFSEASAGSKLGSDGLGGGIKQFADSMKGINEEDAKVGIRIAQELFGLHPPNEGGWLADILGDNNFDKFNRDKLGINGFGGGIRAFTACMDGIRFTTAETGILIAQKLFELKPPNEGGLIAKIIGDNSFDKFNRDKLGENGLGGGIKAFVEQIKDFKPSDVASAYIAAQTLEILTNIDVPDEKLGIFDFVDKLFNGSGKDYKSFTGALVSLGGALSEFYISVKDIDADITEDAAKILYNLVSAMHNMKFVDTKKVDDFVESMGKVAENAIKKYCTKLKSQTASEKVEEAMETFMDKVVSSIKNKKKPALDEMTNFSNEMISKYSSQTESYNAIGMTNSNSYIEGFMSNQDLANFNMEDFANGNYEALIGDNGFDLDGDYSNMFGDLGQFNYDSYMDSFMSNQDLANFNMEQFAQENIGAIMGQNGFDISGGVSKVMETIGNTDASSLIGGLENISSYTNIASIKDATQTVVGTIESKAKETLNYENFKGMGGNIINGVIDGINNKINVAEQSATNAANMIARAFQRANEINSPSRLYMRFGEYMDEGLAIGIEDYASEPIEAIADVGSSMYDSVRDAMGESANYISENMDVNPTITPYVDITGAMRDVDTLNSMFDDTALAYDMQSKFGDMALGSIKDIDATNSDVVSAISNLRSDVASIMNVVGNLKVIMDTGTLVGEIAPGMDNALGQMAMMKRRGV